MTFSKTTATYNYLHSHTRPRGKTSASENESGSVLLPPPARGHGCKEREKPRIGELKKANAGPKGRTLAHRRATSPRSRYVAPHWLLRAKNANVGAMSAKSGKRPPEARRLCSSPAWSSRRKGAETKRPHAAAQARHVAPSKGRSGKEAGLGQYRLQRRDVGQVVKGATRGCKGQQHRQIPRLAQRSDGARRGIA